MASSQVQRAEPAAELQTVRDWLRYAVTRFTAAGLAYGHGTERAIDEAAFLILHTLRLPVDDLEPWLDARLLADERQAVLAIIERRIATRMPAPYLTGVAYIRGHRFEVDERTIVPRSFIAELLCDVIDDAAGTTPLGFDVAPADVRRVLDLCTGGGSIAILAAMAFPAAHVDAADISAPALEVAQRNVEAHGLADRITLVESDLFEALALRRYDLILANPPYVAAAEIAAFPPEHRAEPLLAHAGGEDGLEIVRRVLGEAAQHLEPAGHLVMEIGTGRDALVRERADLAFLWLDTETSQGEVLALTVEQLARKASGRPVPRRRRSDPRQR